ncbi:hypothetical protein Sjap_007847 [Stephania japonica]|uniref:glutathione transferase n=1 Tax=Stephania japonica TaxID=461633 RepID=A0AAP0JQ02_9MAGN
MAAEDDQAVKVLGNKLSPYSFRVECSLKLKGVDYEFIKEDFYNKSERLLHHNPVYKKIPVLIHNGKSIPESMIIVEYIDETWRHLPSLLPQDPYERAMARFWAKFVDEKCVPSIISVFSSVGEDQEKALKDAEETLKTFEKALKGKFFGGETMGFVDVAAAWLPYWIGVAEEILNLKVVDQESLPLLSVWFEEVVDVEIVKGCLPSRDELMAHLKSFRERSVAAKD